MSKSALAVDIGERYIKIADVEKKQNKYEASLLASTPIDEVTANLYMAGGVKNLKKSSSLLQNLVSQSGTKKKSANIIIPDGRSFFQIVEMPELTEKELASAIRYQADQFIPLPMEKITIDLEILVEDKKNKKMKVLLVAAENIIIDKVVKMAEMAGLLPDSVENEMSATLRFLSHLPIDNQRENKEIDPAIFINFGYHSTSILLYDFASNLPLQLHNFFLGLNIFSKEIQANFNLSHKEINQLLAQQGFSDKETSYNLNEILATALKEFVSEIERFISSVKNRIGLSVNNIFIFGEGFEINSFDKKISLLLGVPVKPFDIYSYLITNKTVESKKDDLFMFIPSIGANLR